MWRSLRSWGLVALLCLCLCLSVSAAEVEPVLIAEDEGNGYVYRVGSLGTFTTNVLNGETANVVVLAVDGGLYPAVYQDGQVIDFALGTFFDQGDYQVRFYATEDHSGEYCLFSFVVENDYDSMIGTDIEEMELVSYPEMTLQLKNGQYVYTLPDGQQITTSDPVGSRGIEAMQVALSSQLRIASIYKDGTLYTAEEYTTFSQVGDYTMTIMSNEFGSLGTVVYRVVISFTVGGGQVGDMDLLPVPYGMTLVGCTLDGVAQEVTNQYCAYLPWDGTYTLTYQMDGGELTQTLIKDSTPPAVFFDQVMDGSVLTQELHFTLSDPTATLEIYRGNTLVTASRNTIGMDGDYKMIITDRYGNARSYSFQVRLADDNWGGYLVFIPLALGLGFGLMLMRKFGTIRVR